MQFQRLLLLFVARILAMSDSFSTKILLDSCQVFLEYEKIRPCKKGCCLRDENKKISDYYCIVFFLINKKGEYFSTYFGTTTS